jgi:hypothetical protein
MVEIMVSSGGHRGSEIFSNVREKETESRKGKKAAGFLRGGSYDLRRSE